MQSTTKAAMDLILAERNRQIVHEKYTSERDLAHGADYHEELICAAGTYEMEPHDRCNLETWPWHQSTFKPTHQLGTEGRIKELTKAGALYMAAQELLMITGADDTIKVSLVFHIKKVADKISQLLEIKEEQLC